jgi:hypothetical protein
MFLVLACLCALCGEGLAKTLAGCAGSVTTLSGSPGGYSGRADGPATSALFSSPRGVFFDGADTIYVADESNNIIRAVAQSGTVSTLVGGGGSGITGGAADGVGRNALFRGPNGVTCDGQGNLFIADLYNCVIRQVVIASRAVTTLAGGYSCDYSDGIGTNARFFYPYGVVTRNDDMFVADAFNNVIRRIALTTQVVSTFAGLRYPASCQPGHFNNGIGTQATFSYPTAVSLDASGSMLFIADGCNNLIRMADTRTARVTTLAGIATKSGSADGVGTAAYFNSPQSVAADTSDNLFVFEACGRVRVIDLATAAVYTIAGGQRTGFVDGLGSAALFQQSWGAVGPAGELFIGDAGNNVIRAVDAPCTQNPPPAGPSAGAIVGGVFAAVALVTLCIALFIKRKPILSWVGARTKLLAPQLARALAERGRRGPLQDGGANEGGRSTMSPLSTMQPSIPPPPPIFMPNVSS